MKDTRSPLEIRLEMLLSLLEEQTGRGVERCNLEALARKIRETQMDILSAQKRQETQPSDPVVYEDERDPSEFKHNKPKKWACRSTVRKSQYRTTKQAHPIPMPWHGRLV